MTRLRLLTALVIVFVGALGSVDPAHGQSGFDWGYPDGRAWVDYNGDGAVDYCRVVGDRNPPGAAGGPYAGMGIRCELGSKAGTWQTAFAFWKGLNWGLDAGANQGPSRWWTDINGDGMIDFCRLTDSEEKRPEESEDLRKGLRCRLGRRGSLNPVSGTLQGFDGGEVLLRGNYWGYPLVPWIGDS